MTIAIGNVTINQTTGAETTVAGLAVYFYTERKLASKIPDPTKPKGCTVTAALAAGGTSLQVNTSAGYVVGDRLGSLDYVNPALVGGQYVGAEVTFTVSSIPDPTHIVISPAVPTGASIANGTKFGFTGTAGEWTDQATKAMVKLRTLIAGQSNADAKAIVDAGVPGGAALPPGCSTLVAVQDVATGGVISDLALTANAFITMLRFTDALNPQIDGIVSGSGAFRVAVLRPSGSTLQIVDYTTSVSGASNRFGTGTLLNNAEHGGAYVYDPTSLRWINIGHTW